MRDSKPAELSEPTSKHWSKILHPSEHHDDVLTAAETVRKVNIHNVTPTPIRRGFQGLYVLVDVLTNTRIGGIQLHINHASAVRMLFDVANTPTTGVAKHPHDYELRLIGEVSDDNHDLTPRGEIIITGDQIATMIQTKGN